MFVCIRCLSHCKVRYVSSGISFCLQVRAWSSAFHIVVTQWTNVEWINCIKTVTLTSSKQHQPEFGDLEEEPSEWCHYFKVYSQETWDVSPGTHSRSFYDPRLSFYFGFCARAVSFAACSEFRKASYSSLSSEFIVLFNLWMTSKGVLISPLDCFRIEGLSTLDMLASWLLKNCNHSWEQIAVKQTRESQSCSSNLNVQAWEQGETVL